MSHLHRRTFLSTSALGCGSLALTSLLSQAANPIPHQNPNIKRVIFLAMSGGPPHIDLFDEKPLLKKLAGEELPPEVRDGQRLTGMTANQGKLSLLPSLKPHKNYEIGRAHV